MPNILTPVTFQSPLFGGSVKAAAAGGPLLLDHFTDTAGTLLTAHTMNTGPGWTQAAGTAANTTIQANRWDGGTSAPDLTTADSGQAGVTVILICNMNTIGGAQGIGPTLRGTNASNYWLAWLSNSTFTLYEVNAGAFTSRASSTPTTAASTDYTVQVVASGTTITATVDGANTASYASATFNQTATICGIRSYNTGAAGLNPRGEDFQVTSP